MTTGEGTYDFPAVYFIGILDFTIHKNTDRVLFRYDLRERESFESMTDRLQFIFLELTNCSVLTPESTVLEKVCYALHNMENLPDRPQGFEGELFRLLFESAEIATFTPQEKTKLENDMRTERDLKNQIAYAKEEGLEIGHEGTLHQVEHQLRERGMAEADIAALVQSVREATKSTGE